MVNAVSNEFHPVVFNFVQSDNVSNSKVAKNLKIIFRSVASFSHAFSLVNWTHKCDKLARNYPIQISIFNLFVVLIFFVIEVFEFVPTMAYRDF